VQADLLIVAGAGALVAVAASVAERRHARREDIDRVSVMPWPGIVFAGLLTAILALAFALKG
jgi:hypothetical protein